MADEVTNDMRYRMIQAGWEITGDPAKRHKLVAEAETALARGARAAETVTVPGVFLAELCEALLASMPVESCSHCDEPTRATIKGRSRGHESLCAKHLLTRAMERR